MFTASGRGAAIAQGGREHEEEEADEKEDD
jgi:hypothetical protein